MENIEFSFFNMENMYRSEDLTSGNITTLHVFHCHVLSLIGDIKIIKKQIIN